MEITGYKGKFVYIDRNLTTRSEIWKKFKVMYGIPQEYDVLKMENGMEMYSWKQENGTHLEFYSYSDPDNVHLKAYFLGDQLRKGLESGAIIFLMGMNNAREARENKLFAEEVLNQAKALGKEGNLCIASYTNTQEYHLDKNNYYNFPKSTLVGQLDQIEKPMWEKFTSLLSQKKL